MTTMTSTPSRRRTISSAAFVLVLLTAALVFRKPLTAWFGGDRSSSSSGAAPGEPKNAPAIASSASAQGDIDHWTCSMHPSVHAAGPGKCPICGMELIPVHKGEAEQAVVTIDEARRQLIGVRTGKVVEGPLRRSFRAVGQVTYDESRLADVNLKVQGWITKLFVNQTGQRVGKGQPLFSLYSPELYNAEQDFILASKGASASGSMGGVAPHTDLLRAARQRLHLLGLSDAQIASIESSGAPMESITIMSPANGFVIEKNVVEGASVDPGMRLFRIAALDRVWVEADVYEGDLGHVRAGQTASVTLDYAPGRVYDAKVAYVYPYLDPKNRTGRVRVELANKGLDLRPGMYASVELEADPRPTLMVPAAAVVYTGPRRLVFVDLGQGRLKPQEIRVGIEADGMYEVLEGLHAGDVVATSGVFLIAAEARISTAARYWDDAGDDATSTTPSLSPSSGASPESRAAPPSPPRSAAPVRAPRPRTAPPPSLPSATEKAPAPAPTVYTCVMHPQVRSSTPGKCPICGMDLVPVPPGAPK